MKQISLLIIFSFLSVHSSLAQASIIAGPGLAMNSIKLKSGNEPKSTPIIRYQFGVLYATPGDKVFIESGLLFTRKGSKFESEQKSKTGEVTSRTSRTLHYEYLEIPLNVGYNLPGAKVRVYAGPVVSFGVGGGFESEFTSIGPNETETRTSTGFVRFKKKPAKKAGNDVYANPVDIGVNFGVNVVTKGNLFIGLNANIGLSNNQPKLESPPADYDRKDTITKNRYFGIRIGYLLKD